MLAKPVGCVERKGRLVADARGDGDGAGRVGLDDVPDERGAEPSPEMRGKDDEGADMDVVWFGTLEFRDCYKSARRSDADE